MKPQSVTRSMLVSLAFNTWTVAAMVLGFAAVDGAIATPALFASWLASHWWVTIVGLIINPGPFYRAQQALLNAQKGT